MERFFLNFFIDALVNHYVDFKGKASRKQLLFFFLITFVFAFIAGILIYFIGGSFGNLIFWLFIISMLLPSISIIARRLRDTKHSPIVLIVPVTLSLLSFISLLAGYFLNIKEIFYKVFLVLNGISALCAVYVIILLFLPSKDCKDETL